MRMRLKDLKKNAMAKIRALGTEKISVKENYFDHAISVDKSQLSSIIDCIHSEQSGSIHYDFYLVRTTANSIRMPDFLNALHDLIIYYALQRKEYSEQMTPTEASKAVRQARSRFVYADNTGEPGELILFALLETQRNAPQLLNKMSLKTSGKMHYNGLDAIHIGVCQNKICMYYGESKTNEKRSDAILDAINVLKNFHNSPKKEVFELNLVNNHIDSEKFGEEAVEKIKKILDPYENDKTYLRKVYAVFIGFNWGKLKNMEKLSKHGNFEEKLEKMMKKEIPKIMKYSNEKYGESGIGNQIDFFFIPFQDVSEFRKQFKEMIH